MPQESQEQLLAGGRDREATVPIHPQLQLQLTEPFQPTLGTLDPAVLRTEH